jgi:hypothetical protein
MLGLACVLTPELSDISTRQDMQSFAVSVFPAPLSPDMSTLWGMPLAHNPVYAARTVLKMCGRALSCGPASPASLVISAIVSGAHVCNRLNGFTAMSIGPIDVYTSSRAYRCRSVCRSAPCASGNTPVDHTRAAAAVCLTPGLHHSISRGRQ